MRSDNHMQCADEGKPSNRGFTIIELLIVMVIASLLLAIGMPSFTDFVRDMRARSAMGMLTSDIQLARSESVKRNQRVLFCARAAALSNNCSGAPAVNTWMNGWLVCYDGDLDGACDAGTAADPNPIKAENELQAPLALSGPAATLAMLPVGNISAAANFTVTSGTGTTRTATVAASGSIVTSISGGY